MPLLSGCTQSSSSAISSVPLHCFRRVQRQAVARDLDLNAAVPKLNRCSISHVNQRAACSGGIHNDEEKRRSVVTSPSLCFIGQIAPVTSTDGTTESYSNYRQCQPAKSSRYTSHSTPGRFRHNPSEHHNTKRAALKIAAYVVGKTRDTTCSAR